MDETTSKLYDQAAEFTKLWCELVSKVTTAGLSLSPNGSPAEAVRQARDAAFKGVEETLIEYMRSPQFLESMKQGLDATTTARKTFNDFLTRTHHELQIPAKEDIDIIIERLRDLEEKMARRMDALATRLDEIGERLDALNDQPESGAKASELKRKAKNSASGASKRKARG